MTKRILSNPTRRRALAGGAALLAAPAILPSGTLAQGAGPVRIAGLVSLTGGGSAFGPNMRAVHQAVVDEVNAAGGVLGRRIEYLSEDDQTNPEAGVRGARKLIDVDKVSAILSVWASSVGTAVLPLCWENKVMMIAICAADSIALLPHQGYFVRTQPHTELQGTQFANFAIKRGAKHLYVMMPQTPFTESTMKGVKDTCEPKGIKVSTMIYDAKKTTFRSEIDDMMRARPDMLMMGGYQPDAIVMAKDLFRANFKQTVIGFAYGMTPQFVEGAGKEAVENMYSVEPVPSAGASAYARLKTLIKRDELDIYVCQAYDHANLAILSMAKAGAFSGTAIRDNIRKVSDGPGVVVDNAIDGLKALAAGRDVNYEGASGPCKFADNGNIIDVQFRYNQIRDGKIVEVKL
ncbi:MAG: amino acid ABC transporter substrate-binding protein [Alphaproteobacteria bacterium]|nr:amino acid ABC transporter substrate-binding protein [Alphaproteobacteria bacterium]